MLRKLGNGRVVDAREAFALVEAIEAYTIIGHRTIYGHPGQGKTPGAVADLAIVSGDPLAAQTQGLQAWIAGRQVWPAVGR